MLTGKLLAIVSVDPAKRVQCQNPGCGHGVYAAIHVVEEGDGRLTVLGSTCFAKRYGNASALGNPAYSSGVSGAPLTEEERQILVENTAELMARFKQRFEDAQTDARSKLQSMRERFKLAAESIRAPVPRPAPTLHVSTKHPWPWQARGTSAAVLRSPEGQFWVRVQHEDGTQALAPWPVFEGWDEAFPPAVGTPSVGQNVYRVDNIIFAIRWLREIGFSEPTVTRWPDVLAFLPPL